MRGILSITILHVTDLSASKQLFLDGFGFPCTVDDDDDYVEFSCGKTRLGLKKISDEFVTGKQKVELYFHVQDVEAIFAKLVETGATSISAPARMPWGDLVGYVSTGDGHVIAIASSERIKGSGSGEFESVHPQPSDG
ncbi:MAG: hypothetical protein NUW37_08315 [Planctomycetes bacterium]|nr:hypothetical protein [Planctomycetota bacterium]